MASLSNTCRICGLDKAVFLVNLFAPGNEETRKMFDDLFASIEIEESNELPHNVCHLCTSVTSEFYRLWLNCSSVQEELNSRIQQISARSESGRRASTQIVDEPLPKACAATCDMQAEKSVIPETSHQNRNIFNISRSNSRIRYDYHQAQDEIIKAKKEQNGILQKYGGGIQPKPSAENVEKNLCENSASVSPPLKKRGRGRPRKKPLNTSNQPAAAKEIVTAPADTTVAMVVSDRMNEQESSSREENVTNLWQEYSLPGKVLYKCLKCKAMLLTQSGKSSHECSGTPQVTLGLKRCLDEN